MNTWQKGELAVIAVLKRSVEKGYIVSRPLNDSARYDLILDDGKDRLRIQIKYAGEIKNGSMIIPLKKVNKNGAKLKVYHRNEIDLVIAYCVSNDKLYRIPSQLFHGKTALSLRLGKSKNNQSKGCHYADDFLW